MTLKIPPSYRIPLIVAIVLHGVLFIVLLIQRPAQSYRLPGPSAQKPIIQASAVDQSKVDAAVQHIEQAQQLAVRRAQQRVLAAKRERIEKEKHLAELKAARIRLKKQRELAKKRQLKQAALAKAKAREKQKQLRKLAIERAQLQQKLMSSQLRAEQNNLAQLQSAQTMGIIDRYRALILQAISQYWLVPPNANKQLSAVFLIQLAPGGVVLSVQLIKSSGDAVLDRSAQNAINQASPLPVPKDPAVFDKMRSLRLTVRPESAVWKNIQ